MRSHQFRLLVNLPGDTEMKIVFTDAGTVAGNSGEPECFVEVVGSAMLCILSSIALPRPLQSHSKYTNHRCDTDLTAEVMFDIQLGS